jgi:2-dehydro-3-deoxyphosphogluconate aldolase / (4S)-4-hydroxy-2-oxoglutarate aldolase
MNIYDELDQHGIVAVIRADSETLGHQIAKACYDGGIRFLEITFTVPNADLLIRKLINDPSFSDATVGAGTIIDLSTAQKAIDAGSQFIVGPNFDSEVANLCLSKALPYFPGCMTINEMIHALKYGVKVIKLFPGSVFGPSYIKAIKGPLPNIKIMPTGGVSLENLKSWVFAGACALGVGSELTNPAKHNRFDEVTKLAALYVNSYQQAIKERGVL